MRRMFPVFALLLLAACTPADLLRLFYSPVNGSSSLVFFADTAHPAFSIEALDDAAAVVQRRLDLAGINAQATVSGERAISVSFAANPMRSMMLDFDTQQAVERLVTQIGRVEFADLRNAPYELISEPNNTLLDTSANRNDGALFDPVTGAPYETVLDAVEIVSASTNVSQFNESWDILLQFSPEHASLLSDYSAANIGTSLGILVDGRLLSAPTIQAQIGEEALIAGDFSEAEARQLAAVIGGGTLQFALELAIVGSPGTELEFAL